MKTNSELKKIIKNRRNTKNFNNKKNTIRYNY